METCQPSDRERHEYTHGEEHHAYCQSERERGGNRTGEGRIRGKTALIRRCRCRMIKRTEEIEVDLVPRLKGGVSSQEGSVCDEEEEGFVCYRWAVWRVGKVDKLE